MIKHFNETFDLIEIKMYSKEQIFKNNFIVSNQIFNTSIYEIL